MAGDDRYRDKLAALGAEIKARRESLGLSIEQVTAETKIRTKYLRAVEDGDDSAAPAPTYFRAFMKTYANFLGLDGMKYSLAYQELLDEKSAAQTAERHEVRRARPPQARHRYETSQAGAAGQPPQSEKPVRTGARRGRAGPDGQGRRPRRRSGSSIGGVLFLVILLAAAAATYYALNRKPDASIGHESSQTPGAPESGGSTPPPETPPAPAPPKIVRSDPDRSTTNYTIDRSPIELVIKTGSDAESLCWLRVSADGKQLFEKTLSPNSEERISAQSEITLRAGKPWVITLELNGQSLGTAGEFGPVKDITVRSVPKAP